MMQKALFIGAAREQQLGKPKPGLGDWLGKFQQRRKLATARPNWPR